MADKHRIDAARLDVENVCCDLTPQGTYVATMHYGDAGKSGTGATPEEACKALSKATGKPFVAHHRGASISPAGQENGHTKPGPIIHSGEGATPHEAWVAANKAKSDALTAEAKALAG